LGGNGFIGTNLAISLRQKGEEVVIVGRREKNDLPEGCTYIQGDCLDTAFIDSTIKENDKIVYLAYNSVPKTSFENPLKDINENLSGAVALFSVLKDFKIDKLMYVSSGGTVYGKTSKEKISEEHLTNPISPYGITKLTIEKYAHFFAEVYHLPIVIARPANPFGPFQNTSSGQGFVAAAINAALTNSTINIFGNNGTIRDYIYIDDLTSAFSILLNSEYRDAEIFNIGSGIGRSNKEIVDEINRYANADGFNCAISHLPERVFDVPYNVLDCTKLKTLGWNATTNFEEALIKTWNWYLNIKYD